MVVIIRNSRKMCKSKIFEIWIDFWPLLGSESLMRQKRLPTELTAYCRAKQTPRESISVSTETKLASPQHLYAACEARSASKASWIEKSTSASRKAKRSLVSASGKARVVSSCETTSTLHSWMYIHIHKPTKIRARTQREQISWRLFWSKK